MAGGKRRISFLKEVIAEEPQAVIKSAEQLVEERPTYVHPDDADPDLARMRMEENERRRQLEGEIRAKSRARTLLSMEVARTFSPSERLRINLPEGYPFGLRWCDDEYRLKMGMDIWVPVTAEEYEDLKQFVNADQAKVGEDGRIYSGRLFLAKAPRNLIEQRSALFYQRSQRHLRRASQGAVPLMKRGSGFQPQKAGASMEEFAGRMNAGSDEAKIRFTGTLRDDSLAGYEP